MLILFAIFRDIAWLRGMQAVTGLLLPTVVAGCLYRSANLYHPRRRAILHLKSLKKTKKQQREFEDKPPYLDFGPLRMRSLQVLMAATFIFSLGGYTPFILVVSFTYFFSFPYPPVLILTPLFIKRVKVFFLLKGQIF